MRRSPAVARVLERVTRTAREHEMFRPGDVVLVCVSGGPDSVCLLYSLWYLRRLFRIRLEVFHFDHRLRPGAAKEGAYVARLAERLRVPFHLRSADDAPARGVSVEAWATADSGETWARERLTPSTDADSFRPTSALGGSTVLWMSGKYAHYTRFDTRIVVAKARAKANKHRARGRGRK